MVAFTACLISFIFQQLRIGSTETFKQGRVNVDIQTILALILLFHIQVLL